MSMHFTRSLFYILVINCFLADFKAISVIPKTRINMRNRHFGEAKSSIPSAYQLPYGIAVLPVEYDISRLISQIRSFENRKSMLSRFNHAHRNGRGMFDDDVQDLAHFFG